MDAGVEHVGIRRRDRELDAADGTRARGPGACDRLPRVGGVHRAVDPVLPHFWGRLGLGDNVADAGVLTASREMGSYYEAALAESKDPAHAKLAANWVMGDFSAFLNRDSLDIDQSRVNALQLAALLKRIADNTISGKIAKEVFEAMVMLDGTTR